MNRRGCSIPLVIFLLVAGLRLARVGSHYIGQYNSNAAATVQVATWQAEFFQQRVTPLPRTTITPPVQASSNTEEVCTYLSRAYAITEDISKALALAQQQTENDDQDAALLKQALLKTLPNLQRQIKNFQGLVVPSDKPALEHHKTELEAWQLAEQGLIALQSNNLAVFQEKTRLADQRLKAATYVAIDLESRCGASGE